jgi:hypothetical protein
MGKLRALQKYMTEDLLLTAGGKIACRRCKAVSGRTKQQCGRPAIRHKQVCQFHGGRSTGPKSEEAKSRLKTLNLKHGEYIKEKRVTSSKQILLLRYLEDVCLHLGLFSTKTRGPKPTGYIPLNANVREEYIRLLKLSGLIEN